jgi:hypothetical protein
VCVRWHISAKAILLWHWHNNRSSLNRWVSIDWLIRKTLYQGVKLGYLLTLWIIVFQILHETGGSKVEVVNINTMTALSFSLPFHVSSISVPSVDKWLIEDTAHKWVWNVVYVLMYFTFETECITCLLLIFMVAVKTIATQHYLLLLPPNSGGLSRSLISVTY